MAVEILLCFTVSLEELTALVRKPRILYVSAVVKSPLWINLHSVDFGYNNLTIADITSK